MLDTRVQLPTYSMWATTPIYEAQVDGETVVVFGLLQDVVVPDATDTLLTVPISAVNRLDRIADAAFGVPDLWFSVARVNGLLDPLVGFPVGAKIRLPAKTRMAQEGLLSV